MQSTDQNMATTTSLFTPQPPGASVFPPQFGVGGGAFYGGPQQYSNNALMSAASANPSVGGWLINLAIALLIVLGLVMAFVIYTAYSPHSTHHSPAPPSDKVHHQQQQHVMDDIDQLPPAQSSGGYDDDE